jgi:hypothetical protein
MKIKTAAILALTVSTLFSNAARAEEANVNLIIYKSETIEKYSTSKYHSDSISHSMTVNTAQTDITMTACKILGKGLVDKQFADQVICLSKTGDAEGIHMAYKDYEDYKNWEKITTQKPSAPK